MDSLAIRYYTLNEFPVKYDPMFIRGYHNLDYLLNNNLESSVAHMCYTQHPMFILSDFVYDKKDQKIVFITAAESATRIRPDMKP